MEVTTATNKVLAAQRPVSYRGRQSGKGEDVNKAGERQPARAHCRANQSEMQQICDW